MFLATVLVALITGFDLLTIIYLVYLKAKLSQLPILFRLLTGYISSVIIGKVKGIDFVVFNTIKEADSYESASFSKTNF